MGPCLRNCHQRRLLACLPLENTRADKLCCIPYEADRAWWRGCVQSIDDTAQEVDQESWHWLLELKLLLLASLTNVEKARDSWNSTYLDTTTIQSSDLAST